MWVIFKEAIINAYTPSRTNRSVTGVDILIAFEIMYDRILFFKVKTTTKSSVQIIDVRVAIDTMRSPGEHNRRTIKIKTHAY